MNDVKRFESVSELARFIDNRGSKRNPYYEVSDRNIDPDFRGVSSIKEADDLMRYGYKVSAQDKIQTATFETSGQVKVNTLGVVGYAPHVPNAINGLPLCMRNKKKVQVKNKVIDMYYDASFNVKTSSEQIHEKGKRMVAMIQEHERKGIRVNLWVVASAKNCGGDKTSTIVIKYKDAKQPLNIGRLYYPLLHPSFLRVQLFRVWSVLTDERDDVNFTNSENIPSILHIDGVKSIMI